MIVICFDNVYIKNHEPYMQKTQRRPYLSFEQADQWGYSSSYYRLRYGFV